MLAIYSKNVLAVSPLFSILAPKLQINMFTNTWVDYSISARLKYRPEGNISDCKLTTGVTGVSYRIMRRDLVLDITTNWSKSMCWVRVFSKASSISWAFCSWAMERWRGWRILVTVEKLSKHWEMGLWTEKPLYMQSIEKTPTAVSSEGS